MSSKFLHFLGGWLAVFIMWLIAVAILGWVPVVGSILYWGGIIGLIVYFFKGVSDG